MQASYNLWLVGLSIVVAMVVSYTALKLAARVAEGSSSAGRMWLLGGAAAMGMGIWSMHFIGMLAYSVEIPLRYGILKTVLSLVIAMITSGFALAIASRPQLSLARLATGSVVMGAGICAMHYSGMAAIQIVPMISYQPMLVLASIGIAVGASFAALWLAFKLRSGQSTYIALARGGAAAIMGLAISGMHYTAMAASKLAVGAYCFGGASFDNNWLAGTIGLVALGILGLTLITAVYDSHLLSQTRKDAQRLEQVNAALQHGKNLLALATRAAGISSWEVDIATRRTLWTENEIESLRQAGVDTRTHPDAIMELTHPADRSIMFDAINAAVAGEERGLRFPLPRDDSGRQRRAPRSACPHLLRCHWQSSAHSGRVLGRDPPGARRRSASRICSCSCAMPRAMPAWRRWPPACCTAWATCSTASAFPRR